MHGFGFIKRKSVVCALIKCFIYSFHFPLVSLQRCNYTENSSAVLPSKIKRTSSALSAVAASSSKLSHDEKDHYESDLEDYDTDSPAEPLPLYQQRENYFT